MNQELLSTLMCITNEEQELLDGRDRIDNGLYMDKETTVIDSRKLLEEGKLITVRPHTRFAHFPVHTHNYVEVIYMCSGKTKHIINGQKVTLNQGELLFLNQKATQEIYPAGYDDVAVNLIVLPEFFDITLQMIGQEDSPIRDFLLGCIKSSNSYGGYLHFRVSDVLPIQNLMENLIWTIVNKQRNERSINQITMGLLFLQLMNHTDRVSASGVDEGRQLALVVLRYVEEHYRDGELEELSRMLHYDSCWLSRQIKKLTGKSYTELLQAKRLSQAAFLLRTTAMSVYDIGLSVGYENRSYFHRIFKDRYNDSPRGYREKHKSIIK